MTTATRRRKPAKPKTPEPPPLLLTAAQAAKRLNISLSTFYRHLGELDVPAIRFGAVVRYHTDDVEAAAARQQEKARR